jgi:hypothetical protein
VVSQPPTVTIVGSPSWMLTSTTHVQRTNKQSRLSVSIGSFNNFSRNQEDGAWLATEHDGYNIILRDYVRGLRSSDKSLIQIDLMANEELLIMTAAVK